MKRIISCCGFRCDQCLAFRKNIHGPHDQERAALGWKKFYGIKMAPEQLICDGCLSSAGVKLDDNCPVRSCATERKLANCSRCSDYPCARLRSRSTAYLKAEKKFGAKIPADEYQDFILPYAGKANLDRLRRNNS